MPIALSGTNLIHPGLSIKNLTVTTICRGVLICFEKLTTNCAKILHKASKA